MTIASARLAENLTIAFFMQIVGTQGADNFSLPHPLPKVFRAASYFFPIVAFRRQLRPPACYLSGRVIKGR